MQYFSTLKPLEIDSFPKISIVTPSYNSAGTIAETIESVVKEDYPDLDYLVVDGNSSDDTVNIAKQYEPALRILSEPDKGQSDAINKGFELTRGDIIGWLNADDILLPGALKEIGDFFMENPTVVAVYGDSNLIDEKGAIIGKSWVQPFDRWRLIHSRNFIEQQSCFFRRDAFESAGGLDVGLNYVMDWNLWIRLSMIGDLVYIPKILSARRITPYNKSESGGLTRLKEIYKMVKKYGANFSSPVFINYLYESIMKEARWGEGIAALPAKIISPVMTRLLGQWFNNRMVKNCYRSFPNGDVPPKGALVIPPSSGGSTLALKFWAMTIGGVSSYKIRVKINRGDAEEVVLKSGEKGAVELTIKGLKSDKLNVLELSSSSFVNRFEQFIGAKVKVSARLEWEWV